MLIDTHAHLDDPRFDADLVQVLSRARAAGVGRIVTVGAGLESSLAALDLAGKHPDLISAALGIHPHDADRADESALARLESLAANPAVVAVGETGLDYHYLHATKENQARAFTRQVEISLRLGKPLVIHCREAHADCLDILRRYAGAKLRGVAHCFSGSLELACDLIALGFHISFAGPLTFPNARSLREVAAAAPLDRVVIETDCPWLAPQPVRGRRNEPECVRFVAEELARIRGISVERAAEVTTANALVALGFPALAE